MSQPFAGYPVPVYRPRPRALRRLAVVVVVLMAATTLITLAQTLLLWASYDDVKRLVYGLLSEQELDRGVDAAAGAGPLVNLFGYVFAATGITLMVLLWQARENTEALRHPQQPGRLHRHAPGWTVGGWFCPVVQFWYPLQVVEDIARASRPPDQPGQVPTERTRGLLYGWWAAWVGFCVIAVGGGLVAVVSFVGWTLRLAERADAAEASGGYVDIYDLQDYLIRLALGVNLGFTLGTVLLAVAGTTLSVFLLRLAAWQGAQTGSGSSSTPPPSYPPPDTTPRYAPRPFYPAPGPYPSGPPPAHGAPPAGGFSPPPVNQPAGHQEAGPYGPGGYGGSTGYSPVAPPQPTPWSHHPPPRSDHPTAPTPTWEAGPQTDPPGSAT